MKTILFNTEMVRAILAGRKTATRRVIKQPVVDRFVTDEGGRLLGSFSTEHTEWDVYPTVDDVPYRPGDILYVRETWAKQDEKYYYRADYAPYTSAVWTPFDGHGWHPSIHMPREAARIFLRMTDVRVERLQEISEESATQ